MVITKMTRDKNADRVAMIKLEYIFGAGDCVSSVCSEVLFV